MPDDPRQNATNEIGPGTRVRHRRTGSLLVIDRRKEDDSGWWNTDGSGFSDHALTLPDWEILDAG